jgi:hypothetical protein
MIAWVGVGALVLGAALWGPIVSDVEQAKYEVVTQAGAIEIRDYAPHLAAEVIVSGERKEAINQGFRMLAGYIFGNNSASDRVAMTAPVTQKPEGNGWKVRFVMPASYTRDTLPKPGDARVAIVSSAGGRFAAIRFSGMAGQESLDAQLRHLRDFMDERGLKPLSEPVYAFFNPPWTLPFLRRNEIMIETGAGKKTPRRTWRGSDKSLPGSRCQVLDTVVKG